MKKLTVGSLFSGIGGIDLGLERTGGFETKWQVEIDEYCNKVLAKHWPHVQRFRDVREVGKHNLPPVDLIAGGFPCQDVSLAGERKGLEGERSTLWTEFARVIGEIKPQWVLVENVPGLLSSDSGRFLGNILRDLALLGYDAEWVCLPASTFGALHIRERFYMVAYSNESFGTVLLFPQDGRTAIDGEKFKAEWGKDWKRFELGPQITTRTLRDRYGLSFPNVPGMATGLPAELDRNRALGNSVVPAVVQWIGERIIAYETNHP